MIQTVKAVEMNQIHLLCRLEISILSTQSNSVHISSLNISSEEEFAVGSDDDLLNSGITFSRLRRPRSALEDLD